MDSSPGVTSSRYTCTLERSSLQLLCTCILLWRNHCGWSTTLHLRFQNSDKESSKLHVWFSDIKCRLLAQKKVHMYYKRVSFWYWSLQGVPVFNAKRFSCKVVKRAVFSINTFEDDLSINCYIMYTVHGFFIFYFAKKRYQNTWKMATENGNCTAGQTSWHTMFR